jgi:hypothetical protein
MRSILVLAVLALVLALAGCGGSGGGMSSPAPRNPFGHTFDGTFATAATATIQPATPGGTLHLAIAQNGAITGAGHNVQVGQDFTVSGTYGQLYQMSLTFQGPTAAVTATGLATFDSATNHFTGTLTKPDNSIITVNLVQN